MQEQEPEMVARGGPCNHRRCAGGPCKQWADEEFTPEPADCEMAKKLVEEGWMSVSSKYRRIVRWTEPPPDIIHMINPEIRDTYWGRLALSVLSQRLGVRCEHELHHEHSRMHRPVNSGLVEVRTLSLKEFVAFKKFRKERDEKDKAFYADLYKPVS